MAKARVRIIQKLTRNPRQWIPRLLGHPRKRDIAREYLEHVDAMLDEDPARALPLCQVAIRFCAGVDSPALALAFGALGHGHRALGHYEKARRAIEHGLGIAADDAAARAVLLRRRSYLHWAVGEPDATFADLEDAIRLDEGHDDGIGRSLHYRSCFQWHRDSFPECEQDARSALTLLCPKASPHWRSAACHTLTMAIAKSGKLESVRDTLAEMPRLYENLKGHRGISAERAKVKWLEGLLYARLGSNNRAGSLLGQAHAIFLKLRMPEELAAVTADLALVLHPDRDAIREMVRPVGKLERAGEIHFSRDLGDALGQLWNSTQQENPREDWIVELVEKRHRAMLEAIGSLRGAFKEKQSVPVLLIPAPPKKSPSSSASSAPPSPIGF